MYTTKLMTPLIKTEDLINAQEVAGLLCLAHRNSVSLYLKRYPDMPRPVVDRGHGYPRLWDRSEIVKWARATGRTGRTGRKG